MQKEAVIALGGFVKELQIAARERITEALCDLLLDELHVVRAQALRALAAVSRVIPVSHRAVGR